MSKNLMGEAEKNRVNDFKDLKTRVDKDSKDRMLYIVNSYRLMMLGAENVCESERFPRPKRIRIF